MYRDRHRFAYLADRILASDPSLDRWRSGLRAVLTAGIAAAAFLLLTRWAGLAYKLALPGIVVPMMSVVAVQDPGRARQQVTMAWVPVVASVALVIGTFVAANPWLSGGLFLATIFAAFEARRFGPRGTGLGTIAYQAFFYALLFKTPPDKVQWTPLFVVSGCAIAWAVHFWLVPQHPGRLLHAELRAWRARADALLHDLVRWLDHATPAGRRRVDTHLAALNDQSLGLDARLAGFLPAPDDPAGARLRQDVLRCELALETLANVVLDAGTDARPALAARLRALDAADTAANQPPAPSLDDAARWRWSQALQTFADAQPWRQPLPAMRDERQPQAPSAKPTRAHGNPWSDATTRRALQASSAALGAILAGHAISPSHWFWAVFAAFIVFTRAGTVGQTLSGAWRQVLASVAGVGIGIAVAELAYGSRDLELALLFVFIALGFYAFRGLQNVYTVMLTAMLAMLYELMGMNSPDLLLLRLAETVAGAASAVLAARLVMPVHTNDASDDRSADLLRAASGVLGLAGGDAHPPLARALRELDRALQSLRQALGPVTGGAYPGTKDARRRHLGRLVRIAHCVRHCYALVALHAPGLAQAAAPQAALGVLRRQLEGVATMLESPVRPAPPVADLPRLAPLDPVAIAAGIADEAARVAAGFLAETDALVRALQAELAAPSQG